MAERETDPTQPNRPRSARPLVVGALTLGAIVGAAALSVAAHAALGSPSAEPSASPPPSPEPLVSASPQDWYSLDEPGPVSFTLVAAGDVLPHEAVVNSAHRSGAADWDALWSDLDPWISGADLAFCHMEVPVAPAGTSTSGYPNFAGPADLVPALKAQGWDGCSTASNHSVDKGFAGVETTLDAFDAVRMGAVGTSRSSEESASAQLYRVRTGSRTITVAHISYSYGLNGHAMPSGHPYAVATFNASTPDVQPILDAAQRARDDGADVVIASVHCCTEYVTQPTRAQAAIAQAIADSGLVDLYIGHHAHVPQPITLLSGGPNGDGMWTAYGLGNYISNQDATTVGHSATSNGELLVATFTVGLDDTVTVDVQWAPITVDRRDHHRMRVLTEIASGAGTLTASEVAARLSRVTAAAGTEAAIATSPPEKLADYAFPVRRQPWAPGVW